MRNPLILFLLAALFAVPAHAIVQCQLTATPVLILPGGWSELLGPVVLQCEGGPAAQPVRGTIQIATTTSLGNRVADGFLPEVQLSADTGGFWTPLPGVKARLLSENVFVLEGVDVLFDLQGRLALRITGIRAESAATVSAGFGYVGSPELPLPSSVVILGREGAGIAANGTTAIQTAVLPLPDPPEFNALMARRVPFLTSRVTEAGPHVFSVKTGQAGHGARILVRFLDVLGAARLLVPDAVAGSSAKTPTSAGDMGLAVSPGEYDSAAGGLLLSRVRGADENGAGGELVFSPQPGLNALGALGDAEFRNGYRYAVYEVLSAQPAVLETFQFPLFIAMPPEFRGASPLVGQQVSLAPVSEVRGVSPSAPIPRYVFRAAPNDCQLLDDCSAPYFPRLAAYALRPLSFTAAAGSGPQDGYILLRNDGGGWLVWQAVVRYRNGSDWIRLLPPAGVGQATLRFDVLPMNLPPGTYVADVVLTAAASAGEIVFPVTLTVSGSLPPAAPPPVVRLVVNAANRVPRPVAPASLVAILGENFTGACQAAFSGRYATLRQASAGELLVEVPPDHPVAQSAPVVVSCDGRRSLPSFVEVVRVAPEVLFSVNDSGGINGALNPAPAGGLLDIYVTGAVFAAYPLSVKIHDVENLDLMPPPPDLTAPPGVRVFRVRIPEWLPSMGTSLLICGQPEGMPEMRRCGHPADLFVSARP